RAGDHDDPSSDCASHNSTAWRAGPHPQYALNNTHARTAVTVGTTLSRSARRELALRRSRVQLLRAADLRLRVEVQLAPLREPARQPADREQHGEHARGKAHRLVD